jgi:predicted transcriptional regulator
MFDNNQNHQEDIVIPENVGNIYDKSVKVKAIRDLVENNPGKLLKIDHFNKATGLTNAGHHVRQLRKAGYLVRISIQTGEKGHHYAYKWVTPNKKTLTISDFENLAQKWQEENAYEDKNVLALMNQGVIEFIKWLKTKSGEDIPTINNSGNGVAHNGGRSEHN